MTLRDAGLCCAAATVAIATSCTASTLPPRGQVVLYVDTDAIVAPARAASVASPLLAPQVDRMRVEVFGAGKPLAGAARDFPIDADAMRERRIAFGVVAPAGDASVSVRVRLFRADRVLSDEIPRGVALDTTVTLPPVGEEGIVEASVVLRADDFGRVLGPLPATIGRGDGSIVGTWRGGRRVGCAELPRDGEACVPGGAFFFGDPALRGRTFDNDIADERLVWLSPYYLSATEVTVSAFRSRWAELSPSGVAAPKVDPLCTWSVDAGDTEALPLNCVSWDAARAYCRALGGDLPTEAQFEYLASGLGLERAFPWGDDEVDCAGAVWGRDRDGAFAPNLGEPFKPCLERGGVPGVAFSDFARRDRISTSPSGGSGAEVRNMGGNLSEWSLDAWHGSTDGAWSGRSLMTDPVAVAAAGGDGSFKAVRGGAWPYSVLATRAAYRRRRAAADARADVGFRCARPAELARPGP